MLEFLSARVVRENDERTEGLMWKLRKIQNKAEVGEGREDHKLGGRVIASVGLRAGKILLSEHFLSTWTEGSESGQFQAEKDWCNMQWGFGRSS